MCALYQFQMKIYLESFESLYHLNIFYSLNIILNYWFISKTINIRDNFIWMPLPSLVSLVWHSLSFYSVMTIFEVTSCILVLKCFDCSNSLGPFPFLLHHYIGRYIIIQWVNREAMNNSHHDKMIISDNVVTMGNVLSSVWFILITLSHYIASYYPHSFLSP